MKQSLLKRYVASCTNNWNENTQSSASIYKRREECEKFPAIYSFNLPEEMATRWPHFSQVPLKLEKSVIL